MKHKLGIALLAALMALAGTREAYQQLDGLKTSVGEWTRTSILGNLLVSAASGETADAPAAAQQPTVLLAKSHTPCPFERARALAQSSQSSQPSRAAVARDANTDHARAAAKRDAETAVGEFTFKLDAARQGSLNVDEKTGEKLIVRVVPQVGEIAKALGASEEIKAGAEAAHKRELSEADRARVAAEWKKLGLRKVFVRVAREARTEKSGASPAPASLDPHAFESAFTSAFASAFTFKTITGLDEANDAPPAPRANEASHDAPSDDQLSEAASPGSGFYSDDDCPAARPSLDCDGDPLG